MNKPSPTDLKVLSVLREYPQGAMLWQVQKFAEIELKEYALYYLKKAIRKGWAEKKGHLYFLKGDINLVQTTTPYHPKPRLNNPTQRFHAIQAAAKLHRTSIDRAERTLVAMEIPYKKLLGGNVIVLVWRSLELRITSKGRLISHPELPEMPLNIPLEALKAKAAQEAGVITEAFLQATGLTAFRTKLGQLAIEIRYWENGYPKNQIAAESLRDKSRIVYAYDKETGLACIWGDGSPDPFTELETNKEVADKVIKKMMQGIADEVIDPLEDTIKTRKELKEIKEIQLAQAKAGLATDRRMENYAKNIDTHMAWMYDTLKDWNSKRPLRKSKIGLGESQRRLL